MTKPVRARTPAVPAATKAPATPARVLSRGSTGAGVSDLQRLLATKGYLTGKPSGTFDAATDRAAKAFQKAAGLLPANGRVGPKTLAALRAPSSPKAGAAGFVAGAGRPPPRKPSFLPTPQLVPAPITEKAATDLPTSVAGVPVQRGVALEYSNATASLVGPDAGTELHFGQLTRAQYDALKSEFGGRSAVPYDASRKYVASDFLPPALQALVNVDYDSGPTVQLENPASIHRALENEGRETMSIGSTPNCHGTAWEAMRAMQGQAQTHVELLYADGAAALGQYRYVLDAVATGRSDAPQAFLAQLKPGDVVSFQAPGDDEQLMHSSVYVGGGMFFEKQDTEHDAGNSEYPYRLVPFGRVLSPLDDTQGPLLLSAHRPKGALPPGTTTYGPDASVVSAVDAWAAKRGKSVGRLFTTEADLGMGGRVLALALNAAAVVPLEAGADGRWRTKRAAGS